MAASSDLGRARQELEDTLHVGATRPARLLGLPMPLAVVLLGLAVEIQITITSWRGILWAATAVGPAWLVAAIAVANDPYGVNVVTAWARTAILLLDRDVWGGASCSPLPLRPPRPAWRADDAA